MDGGFGPISGNFSTSEIVIPAVTTAVDDSTNGLLLRQQVAGKVTKVTGEADKVARK